MQRFVIPVVTLRDYEPDEPNELFFRLNQSYNLTPPEKRNALHSAARDQVRDLVKELEKIGLLRHDTIGFNNKRLAYDDVVARACVAIQKNTIRKHINNSVVEEVYRGGDFFPDTLDRVRKSGMRLAVLTEKSGKIRFNKGTLQSWLVYCDWAFSRGAVIPSELLASFELERINLRQGKSDNAASRLGSISVALRIYNDRASYRVTDVSSVQARDLAIHLFSLKFYGTAPRLGSEALLTQLDRASDDQREGLFFDFIQSVEWGEPLVEVSE